MFSVGDDVSVELSPYDLESRTNNMETLAKGDTVMGVIIPIPTISQTPTIQLD